MIQILRHRPCCRLELEALRQHTCHREDLNVTYRPATITQALDRADVSLSAAIRDKNVVPPCWSDPEGWSDFQRLADDPVTPVRGCRACPVLAECEARAAFVDPSDLAQTVMAGVQYDAHGKPVNDAAKRQREERDRRLLELVGLESVA